MILCYHCVRTDTDTDTDTNADINVFVNMIRYVSMNIIRIRNTDYRLQYISIPNIILLVI